MTTRNATTTLDNVTRKFRHPLTGTEHGLKFIADSVGGFAIVHYLPAGETSGDFPEVYRPRTLTSARKLWKAIQDRLVGLGYTY